MLGLGVFVACGLVVAWDPDGHAAVGMTAMSGIKDKPLSQLKRLLGGNDIVDIAKWSSDLVAHHPGLSAIYEQRQDRDLDAGLVNCEFSDPNANCGPNNVCTVGALNYYFAMLMNGEPAAIATGFKPPVKLKLTDIDLIHLVVSLVGELHSPSRFGYASEGGGRNTPVSFVDRRDVTETTLYDYWEKDLVQKIIKDRPNFWLSGWTHLNTLSNHVVAAEQKRWDEAASKSEVFAGWASETWKDACQFAWREKTSQAVYNRLKLQNTHERPELLKSPLWQNQGVIERTLLIKPKAIIAESAMPMDFNVLRQKILMAGLRLSLVVNHILTKKDAKNLRIGSGFDISKKLGIKSNSGLFNTAAAPSTSTWMANLTTNLAIIAAVVCIFLIFLRITGESTIANMTSKNSSSGIQMGGVKTKD